MADDTFQARLLGACEEHENCPDLHQGRQVWLRKELAKRGVIVSTETIRKWLSGEAKPREERARALADALGVDISWLVLGFRVTFSDSRSAVLPEPQAEDIELPIMLRPGIIVTIKGLPFDLTSSEANRISNIVLAHVIVE